MKKIVIAIDGYSSCGKSTLAKQLAKELDYIFVDSGAMYRAITLFFLRNNIDIQDTKAIQEALNNITLTFKFNTLTGKSDIFLNGENVELPIREMRVNDRVSDVAALEAVRTFAVAQQQLMGQQKGIVMDGRDIGTTVFPDAALKIFVTAEINIRVKRRLLELREKNPSITEEEVKKNLQLRDQIDSTREVSPLRQAADAIILDNSKLTREEQLAIVLGWAKEKIGN
jgi:cytidylate kinase